jgi:hypothetical protein
MSESLTQSDAPAPIAIDTVATMRMLSSVLQSRGRFFGGASVTFDGARDLYYAFGYKRVLLPVDYRLRYDRGGVAARIIDTPAQATWRGDIEIIEDDTPDVVTAFEQAWLDLVEALLSLEENAVDVWTLFKQIDILANIHHYGVLIIGAPGRLNEPIERAKIADISFIQPFSEEDAKITEYDTNRQSPRYGWPVTYTLGRVASSLQRQSQVFGVVGRNPNVPLGEPIHYSRVLHIPAEGVLDDPVFGPPKLERVWNLLDDLEKVSGGGAEAFFRKADSGIAAKMDPTVKVKDDSEIEKMKAQLQEFVDGYRRILTLRGVDVTTIGNDRVADFQSPISAVFDQLSAATGIPQRILMGSERGELASSEDRSNFNDVVMDRRKQYATPKILRAFINRMIKLTVLPKPSKYRARWPELKALDPVQQATVASLWATINTAFGGQIITPEEVRDVFLGFDPLKTPTIVPQLQAAIARRDVDALEKLLGMPLPGARAMLAAPHAPATIEPSTAPIHIHLTIPDRSATRTRRIEYEQLDGQYRPVSITEEEVPV